ncbi:GNAT family N-acetyltransferase [Luteococcus sp. H138]|uniref:GNAT family N-acetyltransferase n=1 Tax=unclassified Luteococcus TaxID=2639923 RepID=UPI00313B2324
MNIRDYQPSDYAQLLILTCETFQPFYEQSFPAYMDHGAELVGHQHGHWREDYQRQLPQLLPPDGPGRAVVAVEDGQLLGYVIWRPDSRPDHAHVEILAVAVDARRRGLAESLMNRAMDDMRADGRRFVELGTGGDDFHAPARQLYERLGFHAMPLVVYLRQL